MLNSQNKKIIVRLVGFLAMALILFFLYLAPIARKIIGVGGLADDAKNYHLPQIAYFINHPFSFVNYEAYATTLPFYHTLMAWLAIAVGIDEPNVASIFLRTVHLFISTIGIPFFFIGLTRRTTLRNAILLTAPLVTSWYTVSGSVFLGTDGPALSILLLIVTYAGENTRSKVFLNTALVFALAGIRHIYLPFVLPIYILRGLKNGVSGFFYSVVILAPAALLVAFYALKWRGLVPPGIPSGLNPQGVFPYTVLGHLGVTAIWFSAFAVLRWSEWLVLLPQKLPLAVVTVVALLVFALWLMVPTDFSLESGRFGSLTWALGKFWMVDNRSVIVLIMAIIGSACLAISVFDLIGNRKDETIVISLVLYLIALMLTYASYQRYSEPVILTSLALVGGGLFKQEDISMKRAIPLIILCLGGLFISLQRLVLV
jgi:hypothetical protein